MGKYYAYDYLRKKFTTRLAVDWATECEQRGAGEVVVHDVEKEGTFTGYNLRMIAAIADAVNIPVIALGGAAGVDDLKAGIQAGASAVAAGSMFVFHGPLKAVLVTYPDKLSV
jgi:cyclase